jgi:hypothetical protein
MAESFIRGNGNFTVKASDLKSQDSINVGNQLLSNPNNSVSVFSNLREKMATTKDPNEFRQLAATNAFFGSVFSVANNVPAENRDNFIKQSIDVNGDGKFDQQDIDALDENKDGLINKTEINGHLNSTSFDKISPRRRNLFNSLIIQQTSAQGLFDNNGNVTGTYTQKEASEAGKSVTSAPPATTNQERYKQIANEIDGTNIKRHEATLASYFMNRKGLSPQDALNMAANTVNNPNDPKNQARIKDYKDNFVNFALERERLTNPKIR